MIGDTASINLLTGLPGSGKTLRMVEAIVQFVAAGQSVYTCNIDGIKVPGTMPWEDPTNWRDLPAGSVLFIDEAQQFFRARRGGEPAEYLTAMEKIRHDSIRIVLSTQQPNYLDTHLRGLVGFHEHLLRMHGKTKTFIFRNQTVMDSIREPFAKIKRLYDYETWALPQEFFKYYTSAELHTMKYSMPSLLKKALIVGPLALALVVGVWFLVFREGYAMSAGDKAAVDKTTALPSSPSAAAGPAQSRKTARDVVTAGDYAIKYTPMIEGVPWSAPAWASDSPQSKPRNFCITSKAGQGDEGYKPASYTCMTEQGTRFELSAERAALLARFGEPYNPFKSPEQDRQGPADSGGDQSGSGASSSGKGRVVVDAVPSVVFDAAQTAGYGDIGKRSITGATDDGF